MEWNKENLGKLYYQKFGITLTPEELEALWKDSPARTITPRGNSMNIAVSPIWVKTVVQNALARTGLSISDERFKKVREEIIPAIDYVLILKKMGHGEHLICSSDSPDIVLINKDDSKVPGTAYRRRGIPLEVTFIHDLDVKKSLGADSAEKVVGILLEKKLVNNYGEHVTLLVVVDSILPNLDLGKVQDLLRETGKNFKAIDFWISEDHEYYTLARVYPEFHSNRFKLSEDLDPLMY